ncbi:hypothetical protein TVAG_464480 [Trichomonas vaginalis G3]|uniref:Uncharacterized protein n=1 Tax=Trichomonas vaginalis (strain ATCC PRA-98 / G3) TaxID=412133 RepID=A2EEJ3_TRIV3|nr:A-type inclusion protein, putative-related family [Trichomonas vaginalis G3]EAY08900.1 hypothetical protein TVAG_464480 [Trichomonas vaginalis G3]KAI5494376.1 A-type inclusion protein, putative-related family [Trichomonas vaginalis G3]|eukprot:XP_001321123.1 hypothetical protein [Trichomonas vaginalis G3]
MQKGGSPKYSLTSTRSLSAGKDAQKPFGDNKPSDNSENQLITEKSTAALNKLNQVGDIHTEILESLKNSLNKLRTNTTFITDSAKNREKSSDAQLFESIKNSVTENIERAEKASTLQNDATNSLMKQINEFKRVIASKDLDIAKLNQANNELQKKISSQNNKINQGNDDIDEIRQGNGDNYDLGSADSNMLFALTQENESLKSQLDKALELPKELEALHKKNRNLNSQLLEATQKSENLQNRLKLSQQKTQEAENRQFTAENQLKQIGKDLEKVTLEKCQLEQEIAKLKQNQESSKVNSDVSNAETNKFFSAFSGVIGTQVSSFKQAIDSVNSIKEIAKKQAEENGQTKDLQKTIEKLQKKLQKMKELNLNLISENEQLQNEHAEYQNELAEFSNSVKAKLSAAGDQNTELQQTIENLKNQIKQIKDENNNQQNLNDGIVEQKDQEIAKLKDLVAQRETRINELKERLSLPEKQECEERTKLVEEVSKKEQEKVKLQQEIDSLNQTISDLEGKLKLSIASIKKISKEKDRIRDKLNTSKNRVAELEKNVACLNLEKDSHFATQNSTNLELESLKMQLQAAEVSHTQGAAAFEAQRQETERFKKSLSLLEPLVADLRTQVSQLTDEKNKLALCLQKQDKAMKDLEDHLAESNNKNENLEKKLKKRQEKDQNFADTLTSISSVISNNLIPLFQEPLRSKLVAVLNGTPGSPLQKCAAVFSELSNQFEKAGEPAKEKVAEFERKMKEADERKSLYDTILSISEGAIEAFSYVLSSAKRDDETAAKCNQQLNRNKEVIEFAAKSIQNIENVVRGNDLLDTQFASMSFLVGGSFEDRRVALQDIAVKGWDSRMTFDLLCLQLLVNQTQEKEIQALRMSFENLQNEMSRMTDVSGVNDVENVADYIEKLKAKYRKARQMNKQLSQYLGDIESREESIEQRENLVEACEELKVQLSEFDQKVKNLQLKIDESEKEIAKKDSKISSLESQLSNSHVSSTEEIANLRKENADLEHEIDDKNATIRSLTVQLSQLKNDTEIQINTAKKASEDSQSSSQQKQEKLQQMIVSLKDKKKQVEKCLTQKLHGQQKQQQGEIDKLVACQNELKQKLAETVAAMRQQSDENANLSKKLAENLANSEEKNKSMMNDITKLTMMKKSLEVQIQSQMDQHKRELQLVNSQFAFKELEKETQHQEEIATLNAKYSSEKNSFIEKVLGELGILDQIEDDLDEETALQAIHNAVAAHPVHCLV